jgi:type VI secretion system secreted protein Hcp
MAFQFYTSFTGKTQGKFKGGSPTKGHGGLSTKGFPCHAFSYALQAPTDSASGLPTGKRRNNPIVITKEFDSSSPNLFHALATNEGFTSATLSFVKPDSAGKEVVFHTIELTNGAIAGIRAVHPSSIRLAQPQSGKRFEAITLTYQEIAVDGAKNGTIPHSLLTPATTGATGGKTA